MSKITFQSFQIFFTSMLIFGFYSIPVWACKEEPSFTNARSELNHGYAILHQSFKGLAWADELLYFKKESDIADNMVTKLADQFKNIQKKLEKIESDFPAICLNDSGQPWIVREKNKSVSGDRIKSFFSLKKNRKGKGFERTLLLSLSAAMNQMRHLSKVMLTKEIDKALIAFLTDINQDIESLYNETVALLNKYYFVQ